MESDGLSADQLNEIQRHFEETLRAKGIDPSILNNLEFATVAPRRRPLQNKKNGINNGKPNRDNNNKQYKNANSSKNRNIPKIDLSILQ